MSRKFEEKVDVEELARLESPEDASDGKIRVKMPNKRVNEMFALAQQLLGGRRVTVLCEDGKSRMARIPGKMRRRQWVREGDLIIIWPWDFQDSKADVKHRYTKTQAMYLSRKGVLPDDVDMFGMGTNFDEGSEHDDLFAFKDEDDDFESDDDLFSDENGDDGDDELFADDEDDGADDLFAESAEDDELFVDAEDEPIEQEGQEDQEDDAASASAEMKGHHDDDDDIDALFS